MKENVMRKETREWGLRACLLVVALSLLVAGPALARGASGSGILEVKNDVAMTLQLDELTIQVTEDTRIYDGEEKRISWKQIPDPVKVQTTVEFKGKQTKKGGIVATKLVVYMTPN
jgi:hypothetical protein